MELIEVGTIVFDTQVEKDDIVALGWRQGLSLLKNIAMNF